MQFFTHVLFFLLVFFTASDVAYSGNVEKKFSLSDSFGNRELVQFSMDEPGKVMIEAQWTGAPELALILNGPGQTNAYTRKDGRNILKLEYQIKDEDLAKGHEWVVTVSNFSKRGPVNGVIRISIPGGEKKQTILHGTFPKPVGIVRHAPNKISNSNVSSEPAESQAQAPSNKIIQLPIAFNSNQQSSTSKNTPVAPTFVSNPDATQATEKTPRRHRSKEQNGSETLKTGLDKAIGELRKNNWISLAGERDLRERNSRSAFDGAGSFMDAADKIMRKEAQDAVGGPVAEEIFLLAMKTGKSYKEIAMSWRHCHTSNIVVKNPLGGTFEFEKDVVTAQHDPKHPLVPKRVPEGKFLKYSSCSEEGARPHSHIVNGVSGITHNKIKEFVKNREAAEKGTRPKSIVRHAHTEKRFASGKTFSWPAQKNEPWYEEAWDTVAEGFEDTLEVTDEVTAIAKKVSRYIDTHGDTITAAVTLAGATVVAIAAAPVTGGASIGIAAALAGPVLKSVAVIMVDNDVIPVEKAGISKQQAKKTISDLTYE